MSNEKRFITGIILATLAVGVIFLAGAFIAWDVNPGHWDSFGRAVCAFIMVFVFVGVASIGVSE